MLLMLLLLLSPLHSCMLLLSLRPFSAAAAPLVSLLLCGLKNMHCPKKDGGSQHLISFFIPDVAAAAVAICPCCSLL